MNHKRRRPKHQRAGCLFCKPHKVNGYGPTARGGNERKRLASALDLAAETARRVLVPIPDDAAVKDPDYGF